MTITEKLQLTIYESCNIGIITEAEKKKFLDFIKKEKPDFLTAASKNDLSIFSKPFKKSDLNKKDPEKGYTALHICAQDGNIDFAKKLIEAGATIDIKDKYGNTPLFKAVFNNKKNMITLLLGAGANPKIKNKKGVSSISLSKTVANFNVADCFK